MIKEVDKIYLINLQHRKDRLAYQTKQFESLGLPMFEIIRPVEVEDSKGFLNKSTRSCYLTHLKIIEKIIQDQNTCIILEDDALIVNLEATKKTLEHLFNNKLEWDMFYFYNYNSFNQYYTVKNNIANTHAYMISPLAAKNIHRYLTINKENLENKKYGHSHLDVAYIHCVHSRIKVVHANQILINQNKNFSSDIEWYKSDS